MPSANSRHFGNIRKLSSGRFQARYRGPDGRLRSAPNTFARKSEASRWLSLKDAEIAQGDWIAPELSKIRFGEYAQRWMGDRVLKVRTRELYSGLLRNHLLPTFGNVAIGDIGEGDVRHWRKERLVAGPEAERPFGSVTVAKAYRLLHAIFATAIDEDRISRHNPCRIEGAGNEESAEREIISLPWCAAGQVRPGAISRARSAGDVRGPALGRVGRAARENSSTWRAARSGSWKPTQSWTRADSCPRRPSRAQVSGRSRSRRS